MRDKRKIPSPTRGEGWCEGHMKRLMNQIGEAVKGRIERANLDPVENEIRKYILRGFAKNGRTPPPEEITQELKLSLDKVNHTIVRLERADILTKKGKKIISAYPFSAVKTRHKVIFEDRHWVYALCATDALGIHFMLNEDITIISKCPECRKEMKIVVENGNIKSINHEGVIEFVSNREKGECTAKTLCPFINFFCSEEHLEKWREKNTEYKRGEIYSLNEALEHGRVIIISWRPDKYHPA